MAASGGRKKDLKDLSSHDLVRQAFFQGDYFAPRLPELIIDKILDHAEYWKWVERSTDEKVRYSHGRYPYLRLSVPASDTCKKIKKLEISCTSHDQGWSSYPEDHNTLRNTWTWGDLSVVLTNSEEGKEVRRERVYTNVHACREWKVHRRSFSENSELVSALVPGGSEIVLSLNACFPGWENHAKHATIKLFFV